MLERSLSASVEGVAIHHLGEFDFVEGTTKGGVSIRVYSPPGRAHQGVFALDVGIRSLDFYDNFFKASELILCFLRPIALKSLAFPRFLTHCQSWTCFV